MLHMKTIIFRNIQGHAHSVLNCPRTGVVRIYGPNSNGKSSLSRGFIDVVTGKLHRMETRESLISWNTPGKDAQLEILYYEGSILLVNISSELSNTYYEFTHTGPDGIEEVRRAMASNTDSVKALLDHIGYQFLPERDNISLQLQHADSAVPFVNTSHPINSEFVSLAEEDVYAKAVVEALEPRLEELKDLVEGFQIKLDSAKAVRESLDFYDLEQEKRIAEEIEHCVSNYEALLALPSFEGLHYVDVPDIANLGLSEDIPEFEELVYVESPDCTLLELEIDFPEVDSSMFSETPPDYEGVQNVSIMDEACKAFVKLNYAEFETPFVLDSTKISFLWDGSDIMVSYQKSLEDLVDLERNICPMCRRELPK